MDRKTFAHRFGPAMAKAQRMDAYERIRPQVESEDLPVFKSVLEDLVNARGPFEHIDDYARNL